jgi:hypothetical protein
MSDTTSPLGGLEERPRKVRITAKLIVGFAFVAWGMLWTLDNFGALDASAITRWWPVLVLTFGLAKLFGLGTSRSVFAGTLWLLAGTWLMLYAAGVVHHGIDGLWPLALILIGGRIIMGSTRRPHVRLGPMQGPGASTTSSSADGRVKLEAVMAGMERRFRPGVFNGGVINSVMSNIELDLRDATLGEGRVVLEVNAVLGGIVLRVPRHWALVNEATPVLGAIEDHTEPEGRTDNDQHALVLRGAAVMGGVEIRN